MLLYKSIGKSFIKNNELARLVKNFSTGTKEVAKAVASVTKKGAFSLVGGGDSISALKKFDLSSEVSYVSTGGGAMLHFLETKKLPAVQAILD